MMGSWPEIAYHVAISWAAVVAMCGASIGYLLGPLAWPVRIWLYLAAATLFYPSVYADVAGIVMLGLFVAWQLLTSRRAVEQA
ncbi:MAG: hypothetical protein SFW09_10740 [Hyphomicrobiaceae bacterium]|nr:hypothetical protein [Hyphomicrobiaceae bacterium]